ncbi:MAG: tetratricopeptide repeat protein [Muribaculaceae bacterium]|nr:tetratricopeptide repeat protein [Muribaculaceae bacterium]
MADNNKDQQDETTIEKLNSNLTSASEKIAKNQKTIYISLIAFVAIAAAVLCYVFLISRPKVERAFEAYNNVEITAPGNDSVAAAEYKKVAEKHSGDAAKLAALNAAEAYYNIGKYKEAIECLDKFSSSEPVLDANAMVLKGDCYVNIKKYDDALNCYDKAIKRAGENIQIVPRVLLKKANIYDEQKKYDKALECYQKISSEYPAFEPGNGISIKAYEEREKARLGK